MHVRVAEIMTNATVTDSTTVSLASAAGLMWRQQTGSLVIVDGDEIVGIVTERDVLRTGHGQGPRQWSSPT